jgi:hypothetical protein
LEMLLQVTTTIKQCTVCSFTSKFWHIEIWECFNSEIQHKSLPCIYLYTLPSEMSWSNLLGLQIGFRIAPFQWVIQT